MGLLLAAAVWVGLAITCAIIAPSRGRSAAAWFFIALLVSGLFGLILLLALPSNPEARSSQIRSMRPAEEKTCPQCAEPVKKAAVVCRFCGHQFQAISEPAGIREEYRGVAFLRNADLSVSADIGGVQRRWANVMLFRAEVDRSSG